MPDPVADLMVQARVWLDAAGAAGWMGPAERARLDQVEQRSPGDLFADRQTRPLVVAFFGGTGVGKSSLLNRIAGAPLARVGVERPTSREVTLYVHESITLAELPPELPVDAVHVERHANPDQRQILWIDAPDIDSIEESNRARALAWLPHVDLVCYVVSPERYRDDVGWRDLLEREHRHAWLFVLNRWDEGTPGQREDLRGLLLAAGFDDPMIVCTSCVSQPPSEDEFPALLAALDELLAAHGVREFERLGIRTRLLSLQAAVQAALPVLGDPDGWRQLVGSARTHWDETARTIRAGLDWQLHALASRFATQSGGWLARTVQHVRTAATGGPAASTTEPDTVSSVVTHVWDAWADAKVAAWLDALELTLRTTGIRPKAVRGALEPQTHAAPESVATQINDALRAALARPGTALTRTLRRGTGFLTVVLPVLALLWIGWAALVGYHEAVSGRAPYLGAPFAIHSLLVLALAWVAPFAIDRYLRPSLEQTALLALRAGLAEALRDLGERWLLELEGRAGDAAEHRAAADALLRELGVRIAKPVGERNPVLGRLLARSRARMVAT